MTTALLPQNASIDAIAFDLTENETHQFESVLTRNPVESGAVYSDHKVKQPDRYVCDVVVSNTPKGSTFYEASVSGVQKLRVPAFLAAPASSGSVVGMTLDVVASSIGRNANRVQEMLDRLLVLKDKAEPIDILTTVHEYTDMQLVIVGIVRGPSSIGKGVFHLEFEELSVVNTENVAAPKPQEPRGAPSQKKGEQAGEAVDIRKKLGLKEGESVLNAVTRDPVGVYNNAVNIFKGYGG